MTARFQYPAHLGQRALRPRDVLQSVERVDEVETRILEPHLPRIHLQELRRRRLGMVQGELGDQIDAGGVRAVAPGQDAGFLAGAAADHQDTLGLFGEVGSNTAISALTRCEVTSRSMRERLQRLCGEVSDRSTAGFKPRRFRLNCAPSATIAE